MASVRIAWVDTAKGFGIILVVYAHVIRGLVSSQILTWTATVRFIDSWIYTFHMPLFFFLSGLFIFRSVKTQWTTFALDKVRTIAYPYFLWSTITLIIKAPLGDVPNYRSDLRDVPLIFYQPIEQYWFLYVLFILSLTTLAILKRGMRPWMVLILAVALYPGVISTAFYGFIASEVRSYAIYFVLGVVVGSNKSLPADLSTQKMRWLVVLIVFGLLVSSLGGFEKVQRWQTLQPLLAISGIFAIVALSGLVQKGNFDTLFRFLGQYSLEIYVAHTIASAGVRIVLQKVGHVLAPAPHIVLGTLAGLCMPIAMVLIFQRLGFRYGFKIPNSFGAIRPAAGRLPLS